MSSPNRQPTESRYEIVKSESGHGIKAFYLGTICALGASLVLEQADPYADKLRTLVFGIVSIAGGVGLTIEALKATQVEPYLRKIRD